LPLQEAYGNKYSRLHENYLRGKRELPMIRVRLLKRRRSEVKVDPCLVANGMFHAWWPMEGSMLHGQWKVPYFVTNGRFHAWWPMECSMLGGQWNVKEKHLFTSSIFPPITFTQTFNFFL
jgi:hypothetical protein